MSGPHEDLRWGEHCLGFWEGEARGEITGTAWKMAQLPSAAGRPRASPPGLAL